jgi:hypothetical protein
MVVGDGGASCPNILFKCYTKNGEVYAGSDYVAHAMMR